MGSSSLWMLVFAIVCDLCTAYYNLNFYKTLLILEYLLSKILKWSQSVDVARWVRPAIEHAQDVLSGGLGQEWEYDSVLFF